MITCVIHDYDGTLVNSMKAVYNAYTVILGKPLGYVIKNYDSDWRAFLKKEGKEEPEDGVWKGLIEKFGTELFKGTKDYLKKLKADGYKLAIVTSTGFDIVDCEIKKNGLSETFKVIISSDDVKLLKPDPESLLLAVKKLGSKIENCVYVGDTDADAIAAKRIGMKFVGVSWGCQKPSVLRSINNDRIASNFTELYEIIKNM
ncbi:MAG: HAD family hydrolase [Candidatus Aenigmatarchaeota archaeon]